MTGGIIQLVSNSDAPENLWINGDPQITFFKTVYRRHTPFATELIPVKFNNELKFGNSGNIDIPFYGDLVHRMFLVFDIPELMAVFTNSKIDDIKKIISQSCLADDELSQRLSFYISNNGPLDIGIIYSLIEEYSEKYEKGKQENLNILESLDTEKISLDTNFNDLKIILADKWISKKIEHYPIFQLLKIIYRVEKPIIEKTPLLNGKYIFHNIIKKNIFNCINPNSSRSKQENIFMELDGHKLEILFIHELKSERNLLNSSPEIQQYKISETINEFKKFHQLEDNLHCLNTYQLIQNSNRQNINLQNILYDFGPCFYNILNTYNTVIHILKKLGTTIPIITAKQFNLVEDYDIYNDTTNRIINTEYHPTVVDINYANRFLIEENNTEYKIMDFGITENLIFPGYLNDPYANIYNNKARKMIITIKQHMDILFEKYRNNLFSSINKLFFNNNSTNNDIYAYIIPTQPYIEQNNNTNTGNVFNINIWFFYFFKYLDLLDENNLAIYIQNNSKINISNNDLSFIKYLIRLLKINISYYMYEISYLLNDLYSKAPYKTSSNSMKNYAPFSELYTESPINNYFCSQSTNNTERCGQDKQKKILIITYIFHRNHVPTILEIFQFIYYFIDTVSVDKINAIFDTDIINSEKTLKLRSIVKLFYYQIFKFFMDIYDSFRFEAPANFSTNEFNTHDNQFISDYVAYFLRGTGNIARIGQQISISKTVSQMEYYFVAEMLHMRQLQNFYHTLFDKKIILENVGTTTAEIIDMINIFFIKKDNNWTNPVIYEIDATRKYWDNLYQHNILNNMPDNLYYVTSNIDRYNGQSYLYTPYQTRNYGITSIPLLSPMPLPPTNPYGINSSYYDHSLNENINTLYNYSEKYDNKINNFTKMVSESSNDSLLQNDNNQQFKLYDIDYFRIKHEIFKNIENYKFPFDNYHWNILHFYRLIKHLKQIYPSHDIYLLYWLEILARYSINFTGIISGSDIGTINTFIQEINNTLTKELILDIDKIISSMFNQLIKPSEKFIMSVQDLNIYSDNIIGMIGLLRNNFISEYFNYCRNTELINSTEEICKQSIFDNSEKILEKITNNKFIGDIPSIFFRDPDSNLQYLEEFLIIYDNSDYFNKNIFDTFLSVVTPNAFATKTFKDIIDFINTIFISTTEIIDFYQSINKLEWLQSIFNNIFPLLTNKIELFEKITLYYKNIINNIIDNQDIQKIAFIAQSKGLNYENFYNYIETNIKPKFDSNTSEEYRLQLLNQINTDLDYFFLFETYGIVKESGYNFKNFILDKILPTEFIIVKSFELINNEYLLFVHFLINYILNNKLCISSVKNSLIYYDEKKLILDQDNIYKYYNNFTYILDVIEYLIDYLWDTTLVYDLYNLTSRYISTGINEMHLSAIQINDQNRKNIITEKIKIEQILNNDNNRIKNIISVLNDYSIFHEKQTINNLVRTITDNSNDIIQNNKINFLNERNHIIEFIKDTAKKEIVILEQCSKELKNMKDGIANVLQRGKIARTAWIRKLAHFMVEKIYIRFGDDICDCQISDWFETYHQISKHDNQESAYNKMIGNTDDLILFDSCIKKSCTLALPLIFYPNKHIASSIPINASINTKYDITIQLRKFEDLAYKEEFSNFIDPKLYNTYGEIKYHKPEICNSYLMIEYIYLSIEERSIFTNNMLEYLSDEIQYDLLDVADNNLEIINKISLIKNKKSFKNTATRTFQDKQLLLDQYPFISEENNISLTSSKKKKRKNKKENYNRDIYIDKYKLESLNYQPELSIKNNYILQNIIDRTGVPKLFIKDIPIQTNPLIHKKRVIINNNFNHPSKIITILIKPKAHIDICFRDRFSDYFFGEKQWDNYGLYPYYDLSKIRKIKMDNYYQIRENIANIKNYNLGPMRILNEILAIDTKNHDLHKLILNVKKYLSNKNYYLFDFVHANSRTKHVDLINQNRIKFIEDLILLKINYYIICPKILICILCDIISKLDILLNTKKIAEIVNKSKFPIIDQNEILLIINKYIRQLNDFYYSGEKMEQVKNTIEFFYKKYNETIIEKIFRAANIGTLNYHFNSIIDGIQRTESKEVIMGIKLIKQKYSSSEIKIHNVENMMYKRLIYSAVHNTTDKTIEEIYHDITPYALICELAQNMTYTMNKLLNNNYCKHIDYKKILIKNPEVNPLISGYLKFNGENIMPKNSISIMWSEAQAYQYFNHSPSAGMNFHVWALLPLEHSPNGSCNLSRISDFKSVLDLHPMIGTEYPATITTIVLNMNIIRFMSGMNGKAWLARS